MSVNDVHDAFAVLAILALIGALTLVIAKIVSFAAPNAATFSFLAVAHRVQVPLSALVASVATAGSLYFSEFGDLWLPCRFCWFQRIFMYSLAVVLLTAALRRDRSVRWYATPLALIGILLSTWHIMLEHRWIDESAACTSVVSCASPYRVSFGRLAFNDNGEFYSSGFPVTLAVMAFSGFAFILALLLLPEALEEEVLPGTDALGS